MYVIGGASVGVAALLIALVLLLSGGDELASSGEVARPSASPAGAPNESAPRESLEPDVPPESASPPAVSNAEPQWVKLPPPADPSRNCKPKLLSPSDVRVLFEEALPKQTSYRPAQVVCAAAPSPFVAIGERVYDMRSGEQVGHARRPEGVGLPLALSADGRLFACAGVVGNMYQGSVKIDIVDCASGDVAQTIRVPGGRGNLKWDFLIFTRDNHLFSVIDRTAEGTQLFLWDTATGAALRQWPSEDLGGAKTLSADGRYFAAQTLKFARVQVFDVVDGKDVVAMSRPSAVPENPIGSYSVQSIAFSPDGQHLAGVLELKERRREIVVWDARGEVLDEIPVEQTGALAWLPDGSGWLVGLHKDGSSAFGGAAVISRQLRGVAWHLLMSSGVFPSGFAGEDHLLLSGYHDSAYVVFSLQWSGARIQSALKSLESGTAALLPGQAVAVDVEVDDVRFAEPGPVAQALQAAITQRIEQKGYQIDAGSELTMRVKYSEADGGSVTFHRGNAEPVYVTEQTIISQILQGHTKDGGEAAVKKYQDMGLVERDGPFLRIKRGRHKIKDAAPTASAQNTIGTLELGLVEQGADDPIWTRTIMHRFGGARTDAVINNKAVRDDVFGNVLHSIGRLTIPSLVPREPEAPVLPILEDFTPVIAPHARGHGY